MSLLNDALRAAEQRQNRPDVAAAYTGQARTQQRQRRWLLPVLVLLIAISVAIAGYAVLFTNNTPAPVAAEPMPVQTAVPAPEAEPEAVSAPTPEMAEPSVVEERPEPAVAEKVAQKNQTPEPEVVEAEPPKLDNAAPAAELPSEQPTPIEKPVADAKRTAKVPAPDDQGQADEKSQAPSQAPVVKQARETPQAVDLQVSRELTKLLRVGDSRAAEQRLAEIASQQSAPVSREVYARAMLVQERPERALRWLSGAEAQTYPALRLLQARALLAIGELEKAVAVLMMDIPPAQSHAEYRITLATLLQQSGDSVEAARHWSALISVDDSQPAWWVGLAIALESRGEVGGAVKAYAQAAQLPGLSPSLADYVRDRLKTLQAG